MNAPDNRWMHTDMGSTTPTTITVCGMDLADDIMGKISFPDLAFRMVAGRLPERARVRAVQRGARLARRPRHHADGARGPAHLPRRARGAPGRGRRRACSAAAACSSAWPRTRPGSSTRRSPASRRRPTTPRCAPRRRPRSRRSASRAAGLPGSDIRCTRRPIPECPACTRSPRSSSCSARISACCRSSPRPRTSRVAATCRSTAQASPAPRSPTSGFDWRIIRGFALLARTAGLLGHLAEEMREPMAMPLWQMVEAGSTD